MHPAAFPRTAFTSLVNPGSYAPSGEFFHRFFDIVATRIRNYRHPDLERKDIHLGDCELHRKRDMVHQTGLSLLIAGMDDIGEEPLISQIAFNDEPFFVRFIAAYRDRSFVN